MTSRHAKKAIHVWRWPLGIGVLSTIGLVSALFSDGGWGDTLANACLAVPVAVCIGFGWVRRDR